MVPKRLLTRIHLRAPPGIHEDAVQSIRGADIDVEHRLVKRGHAVIAAIPGRNFRLGAIRRQSLSPVPPERLIKGELE